MPPVGMREGPLVLADISGYTKFITSTELEHSQDIITELLDTVVASLSERLELAQLEGDAVFFVGERTGPELIGWLEEAFVALHRRLRDILALTSCPCQACVRAPELTLKLIAHHGVYTQQRIGAISQVHGADVIVPHRLAKNHVPSREYILVCPPVLERIGERAGEFTPHEEDVADFGTIRVAYRDLAPLRAVAYAYERTEVRPDEAKVTLAGLFDASQGAVWKIITDPGDRQRWMGVPRLDYRGGARGSLLGGEYHCHHGPGADEVMTFRVVSVEEPRRITLYSRFFGREVYMGYVLAAIAPERTELTMRATWDTPDGEAPQDHMIQGLLEQSGAQSLPLMREILGAPAAE